MNEPARTSENLLPYIRDKLLYFSEAVVVILNVSEGS